MMLACMACFQFLGEFVSILSYLWLSNQGTVQLLLDLH